MLGWGLLEGCKDAEMGHAQQRLWSSGLRPVSSAGDVQYRAKIWH